MNETESIDMKFDYDSLRRIGLTPSALNQPTTLRDPAPGDALLMRIVETQRDAFTLHDGAGEHLARATQRLVHVLEAQENALTIGDWVLAQADPHGDLWIVDHLPPVTQIARRANDGRRQTLASNVDTALLVMGLDADFNPRRMERYIAIVQASGVVAVPVLTKADLGADAALRAAQLRDRLPASLPLVALNGLDPAARDALAPWLAPGQTLVLLGSSGAGKSTLTNTLTGSDTQDTGGLRRSDGRGRHTTTARSLHRCASGACIIDTPGLRTWRADADGAALAATFEDVEELAGLCRFRDCRHEGEPGCAVEGAIAPDRLLNFRKMVRHAARSQLTPLDRIAMRQRWKAIGKAGSARSREKRG